MRYTCNSSSQKGLTLIELMIAMLLGVFLIGGILQIFISTKQSYRMQENLSRLQENGRFAMDFIARDMRMTGYWGCLNPSAVDVDIAGTNDNNAAADADTLADDDANADSITDDTDTITLRGAFSQPLAGTCGTAVNTAAAYYTHASSSVTYRINKGVLQKNGDDLIEGIENMQILYGEDTDANGTANRYLPANTVGNMANVVSIRISLLVRTIDDNLAAQTLLYSFNGVNNINPGDRRIRRVFTSTIAVRNRLI